MTESAPTSAPLPKPLPKGPSEGCVNSDQGMDGEGGNDLGPDVERAVDFVDQSGVENVPGTPGNRDQERVSGEDSAADVNTTRI